MNSKWSTAKVMEQELPYDKDQTPEVLLPTVVATVIQKMSNNYLPICK